MSSSTSRSSILPHDLRGHPALSKKWGLDEYLRLDLPQKGGPVCMVWHERFKGDPVSRWLRSVVERIVEQGLEEPHEARARR